MILNSFYFQCDFDFQISTYKMILILLNHLYLGDLILILKSSTYNDLPISVHKEKTCKINRMMQIKREIQKKWIFF